MTLGSMVARRSDTTPATCKLPEVSCAFFAAFLGRAFDRSARRELWGQRRIQRWGRKHGWRRRRRLGGVRGQRHRGRSRHGWRFGWRGRRRLGHRGCRWERRRSGRRGRGGECWRRRQWRRGGLGHRRRGGRCGDGWQRVRSHLLRLSRDDRQPHARAAERHIRQHRHVLCGRRRTPESLGALDLAQGSHLRAVPSGPHQHR